MKNVFLHIVVGFCITLVFSYGCKKDNPVASQQGPAVQIVSFSPQCGGWGQQVVISVKGLDPDTTRDRIYFTSVSSSANLVIARVDSIVFTDSLSRIYVRVPTLTTTGPIMLNVDGASVSSQSPFKYTTPLSPVFKSYQPHAGAPGSLVTVIGTGFDTSFKNITVLLNKDTARIISVSTTQLQFKVPVTAKTGTITVLMDCDSIALQGTYTVVPDSIISFSPVQALIGTPVVIATNFLPDTAGLAVKFGNVQTKIDSVSGALIYAKVPLGAVTAPINVLYKGISVTSSMNFIVLPPVIISFSPSQGPIGSLDTIITNFIVDTTIKIRFGSVSTPLISASGTQIITRVPAGAVTSNIILVFASSIVTSTSNFVVTKRNHTITSFSPTFGWVGRSVTIIGTNFNPDTNGLMVLFGNVPAKVQSVSATQIVTSVPTGAATAPINVSFFGETATSSMAFQVTKPPEFSKCLVQIGNIIANIQHDAYGYGCNPTGNSTTDTESLSYSIDDCGGTLQQTSDPRFIDTLTFYTTQSSSYFNNYGSGSSNCTATDTLIIDTTRHMFVSVYAHSSSGSDYFIYPNGGGFSRAFAFLHFINLPYTVSSNGTWTGEIDGIAIQNVLRGSDYSNASCGGGSYGSSSGSGIVLQNIISLTDSSYIRITLTP
jgi:hypothetical protein